MENNNDKVLIFNTPNNFKRGKYLFGKYRIKDVAVILAVVVGSLALVVMYLNVFINDSVIVNLLVVGACLTPALMAFMLYMPMPVYLHVTEYLKALVIFRNKQRKFKWAGIYLFDEEECQDDEEDE